MVLWTPEHFKTLFPAFIIMIILGVVLRIFLGNKSEKIRFIPFQICAVIIFVLEIIKQIKSFEQGYDLYHIPLHFCSLFIFVLPAMAFYHGKYKERVRAVATTVSASLFLFMAIYPDLIYSAGAIKGTFVNFFDFHTVVFHNVATFTFVLIVALKLHTPSAKKDAVSVVVFIAIYCLIASIMAQVLETNYNNFYQCNIAPLQAVKDAILPALGYGLTQTIYVVIVIILDLAFTQGAYQFYRLVNYLIKKLETKLNKN